MIETERRRRRRGAALRSLRRSHNGLPVSCSGNPVNNRVVFGFEVSTRLLIGSSSCRTRLYIYTRHVITVNGNEIKISRRDESSIIFKLYDKKHCRCLHLNRVRY
jgi:hypothetical protein